MGKSKGPEFTGGHMGSRHDGDGKSSPTGWTHKRDSDEDQSQSPEPPMGAGDFRAGDPNRGKQK